MGDEAIDGTVETRMSDLTRSRSASGSSYDAEPFVARGDLEDICSAAWLSASFAEVAALPARSTRIGFRLVPLTERNHNERAGTQDGRTDHQCRRCP